MDKELYKLPVYIWISVVTNIVLWIALFVQSKGVWKTKNPKVLKFSKFRMKYYLLIDLLGGYNIAFTTSNKYFVEMSVQRYDVFDEWIIFLGLLILNVLGVAIFSLNVFVSNPTERNKAMKYVGIILVVLSSLLMVYCVYTFPTELDAYQALMVSVMFIFGVHLLIVRTFLYYSLLKESIKENGVLI